MIEPETVGPPGVHTQIAICGIGLRLPGGIRHTDDFWDLLISGRDARAPIPLSRFNAAGFDNSLGAKDKPTIPQKFGYFLDDDLTTFDSSSFSMGKEELSQCDPQQRLLLEVVHECLEDAGETSFRGSDTGCYIGTFGDEWAQLQTMEPQHPGAIYAVTGSTDIFLANRVSYEFGLRGPSMVIKTACSSSMVALHTACSALACGDASAAIVGGSSILLSPWNFAIMNSAGVLSPDASCKTFDASANGYARAEGVASIYIKRLEDAIRDGNPVRGVIRGTGTNSDGRTRGITVPSGEAQERLMRRTYNKANLDPAETAYVECHGTGTPIGDPIEAKAVANVFGPGGVLIGSSKPAIGHGEGVAGLTAVIKAVVCLEHDIIPPNIKFDKPNPKIPFQEKNLKIPLKPMKLPMGKMKRISVNSFGVGGSNAHAIIEGFKTQQSYSIGGEPTADDTKLLLMSAETDLSLKRQTQTLKEFIMKNPSCGGDLSYTRALNRQVMQHKAFAILKGDNIAEEVGGSRSGRSTSPQIVMIFTGQGAQWAGMGKELVNRHSAFRQDIQAMEAVLKTLTHPPEWSLLEELLKSGKDSRMSDAEIAQPLCTALQVALFRHLQRLDISPAAVIGHSSGEIAAAYAASRVSFESAIIIAYYRGLCTKRAPKNGAMAAIGLGAEEVRPWLPKDVAVACENSPESTTISGPGDRVKAALSHIAEQKPGTFARLLNVTMAYHSSHMVSIAAYYEQFLQQDDHRRSSKASSRIRKKPVRFFSSVTSKEVDASSSLPPEYWVSNMVSPVLFNTALSGLLSSSNESTILLEVGPHSALAGPIRQICSRLHRPCTYIPTQKKMADCEVSFLSSVGRLYQEGVTVNFQHLFPSGTVLSGLPTYPWDYSNPSKLQESRISKSWRERKHPHHCLLGTSSEESTGCALKWRNTLQLDSVDWLKCHKVGGNVVFPFAGYMTMAGEAIRQIFDQDLGSGYHCRNVNVRVALILDESHLHSVEVVTTLVKKSNDQANTEVWFDFIIESYNGTSWSKHCNGEVQIIQAPPGDLGPGLPAKDLTRAVSSAQFYASLRNIGLNYSGEFSTLAQISCSTSEKKVTASVPDARRTDGLVTSFTLHPATIDLCIQLHLCAGERGLMRDLRNLAVPAAVDDFVVWPHGNSATFSLEASIVEDVNDLQKDAVVLTDGTSPIAKITGIHLTSLETHEDGAKDNTGAARIEWLPDFDFTNTSRLIHPPPSNRYHTKLLQELTLLCIIETLAAIEGLTLAQPHFKIFQDWMTREVGRTKTGNAPLARSPGRLTAMGSLERQGLMEEYLETFRDTPWHAAALGMTRLARQAKSIFLGQSEVLELLTEDRVLVDIYNATAFDYSDFIRCLSHARPTLRVLEVGAGTGGTSELIFRGLSAGRSSNSSLTPFDLYTFTDISAGFFPDARARFSDVKNIEYKVFDITKPPREQGFEDPKLQSYDVIIATQVVHATPNVGDSLRNIRALLKQDGVLLLAEPDPQLLLASFIFGHLPGWWLGEEAHRRDGPLMDVERWDEALKSAGFTGAGQLVFDDEVPHQRGFAIVGRPGNDVPGNPRGAISLYGTSSDSSSRHVELAQSLVQFGWDVAPLDLTYPSTTPPDRVILHLAAPSSAMAVSSFDHSAFANLKTFLRSITAQHTVLLVLPRTQMECTDPSSAFLLGIARGLRSEVSFQLFTLEINPGETDFLPVVDKVLQKVKTSRDSAQLSPDMEFVYRDGEVCVGRFHPVNGEMATWPQGATAGLDQDNLVAPTQLSTSESPASAPTSGVSFKLDATYLLIGGARGLGRCIATWLVARGARSIVLFSRSAGGDGENLSFSRELESMGCSVSAVSGSVTNMGDVQRAVRSARSPIKGVFQLAMVLNDAAMMDMSWTQWSETVGPKVDGTWNVHNALLGHDLDIFWMASSISTVFDMPGQGNYQAANIFLQAFCQYRHSLGLPASVMDISPINDVGYISTTAEAVRQIRGSGLVFDGEREFLDCFELSLASSRRVAKAVGGEREGGPAGPWVNYSHITMGVKSEVHLDDPSCTTSWRRNPKMGFYHNDKPETMSHEGAADNALNDLLRRAAEPQGKALLGEARTAEILAHEIGQKIYDLMMRPEEQVDISQSLADIGLDSLMAIGLRRWFRSVLGVQLSVLEIMAIASLKLLGDLTATKLLSYLHGGQSVD